MNSPRATSILVQQECTFDPEDEDTQPLPDEEELTQPLAEEDMCLDPQPLLHKIVAEENDSACATMAEPNTATEMESLGNQLDVVEEEVSDDGSGTPAPDEPFQGIEIDDSMDNTCESPVLGQAVLFKLKLN